MSDLSRRALVIDSNTTRRALLADPDCMHMWRHVTELQLQSSQKLLEQLNQFPCIQALTLSKIHSVDALAAALMISSVADRLQSLVLSECGDPSQPLPLPPPLAQLTSLRILALDRAPDPATLSQLHQLEYLRMGWGSGSLEGDVIVMRVVRWLSVHHALRSLSVGEHGGWHCQASVVALLAFSQPTLDPSTASLQPPLDVQQPCGLTDLTLSVHFAIASLATNGDCTFLHFLPHLTRLQWPEYPSAPLLLPLEVSPQLSLNKQSELSRLHEIRLEMADVQSDLRRLLHLRACTQLRRVQLSMWTTHDPGCPERRRACTLEASVLQQLLTAWSHSIEEIRIQEWMQIQYDEPAVARAADPQPEASSPTLPPPAARRRTGRFSEELLTLIFSLLLSILRLCHLRIGLFGLSDATPQEGAKATKQQQHPRPESGAAAAAAESAAASLSSSSASLGGEWLSLAACQRLQLLELPMQSDIPAGFLHALSTLPRFQTLELRWCGYWEHLEIPPTLLRCMVASRSWSSTHFNALNHVPPPRFNFLQPGVDGGLASQLAELQQMDDRTAQRIRIYDRREKLRRLCCFHIAKHDRTGRRKWQSDEEQSF